MSLCFWNIHGTKNKYLRKEVLNLFSDKDIIVISETHFGKRSKCPKGFCLVDRSEPIDSVKPRGGVAIYKRYTKNIETKLKLKLPDCIVITIVNTKVVIMALYIPPQGSPYYNESYFENMKTVYESLCDTYEVIIVGDLNARVGNRFQRDMMSYEPNPDVNTNQHGHILTTILTSCETMQVVNGAANGEKSYDSKFTYFSGNKKSQIDWCLTNNMNMITDFKILPKLIYSDHCPCEVTIEYDTGLPLSWLHHCAAGFRSYHHYDVNRKLPKTIKLDDLDLVGFNTSLEERAPIIMERYSSVEPNQVMNRQMLCGELE